MNTPDWLEPFSILYRLPSSSHTFSQTETLVALPQSSKPVNKRLKLRLPNLIHEVIPFLLSQMHPFNPFFASSTSISNDLASKANHFFPPLRRGRSNVSPLSSQERERSMRLPNISLSFLFDPDMKRFEFLI